MKTNRFLLTLMLAATVLSAGAKKLTMVVGTYTGSGSEGLYSYTFDTSTGDAQILDSVAVQNPSYLVVSPDKKNIYSVGENGAGKSKVNAFGFDAATGHMTFLNSVDSKGADPCHIMMIGKTLSVANYSSGSLVLFDINPDGTVAEAKKVFQFTVHGDNPRQASSHIHFSTVAPDKKYVLCDNLGGDCIYIFRIDANKTDKTSALTLIDSVKVKAATGPRHLAFNYDGKCAYLITELSDQVIAFNYNEGHLSYFLTLEAAEVPAHGGGDIHVDPQGEYLYASVRLVNDGIAIFKIDNSGFLKKVGYQKTGVHPRNFAITPDGSLLLCACRDSNAIQVYKRDGKTGLLTDMHKDIKLSKPVCVQFVK